MCVSLCLTSWTPCTFSSWQKFPPPSRLKTFSEKNLYCFSQSPISSSDFDSLTYLIIFPFKVSLSSNFSYHLSWFSDMTHDTIYVRALLRLCSYLCSHSNLYLSVDLYTESSASFSHDQNECVSVFIQRVIWTSVNNYTPYIHS